MDIFNYGNQFPLTMLQIPNTNIDKVYLLIILLFGNVSHPRNRTSISIQMKDVIKKIAAAASSTAPDSKPIPLQWPSP